MGGSHEPPLMQKVLSLASAAQTASADGSMEAEGGRSSYMHHTECIQAVLLLVL